MYSVKEIFYSLQGEGVRAGMPHVFVRFAGCNLDCAKAPGPLSPGGFDCDTDWKNGTSMSLDDILREVEATDQGGCGWILFTGGEPALQLDEPLIQALREREYSIAIETNGTVELLDGIDWICCSPKVQPIRIRYADECRCVLASGQQPPSMKALPPAANYLISPANDGDTLNMENAKWCMNLVLQNPLWRLSMQYHKVLSIR